MHKSTRLNAYFLGLVTNADVQQGHQPWRATADETLVGIAKAEGVTDRHTPIYCPPSFPVPEVSEAIGKGLQPP
jgi:hypothetical protein